MEDETIYLTCCSCGSIHTISDAGDLELVEDKREGNKGINGIRVHEASGNDWKQRQYMDTIPKQYQPPEHMVAGVAGRQNQIKADPVDSHTVCPELMAASAKDWRDKNIPTHD